MTFSTSLVTALTLALAAFQATASPLVERQASSAYASPSSKWTLKGCVEDGYPDYRVLSGSGYTSSNSLTINSCLSYCDSQGAYLAGLENANQCFCGASLQNGGKVGPNGSNLSAKNNDGCTSPAAGNSKQNGGGPNHLLVFQSTRTQPTNPTISGATYKGCYPDNQNNRLLPYTAQGDDSSNTVEKCAAQCKASGYDLMGTEYSTQCFCGSSAKVTLPATGNGCSRTCSGNSAELCGGDSFLSIYTISGVNNGGSGQPSGSNKASYNVGGTTYAYQGCYTDRSDSQGRALSYYSASNSQTVESCLTQCKNNGYAYAGLENGNECRCGSKLASFSKNTATCNVACTGATGSASGEICGGGYALTLYKSQ